MAPNSDDKGDFKDKQFAEGEVADKVVEQCKWYWDPSKIQPKIRFR